MNQTIKNLFTGEDGDFTIECVDGKIQCHSFVLYHQSDFFKKMVDWNDTNNKTTKSFSTINSTKTVYPVVGTMYNSDMFYEMDVLTDINQILAIHDLLDEWLVNYNKNILLTHFKRTINKKNWLDLLISLDNQTNHQDLITEVLNYFQEKIIHKRKFLNKVCSTNFIDKISKSILGQLFKITINHVHNKYYNSVRSRSRSTCVISDESEEDMAEESFEGESFEEESSEEESSEKKDQSDIE